MAEFKIALNTLKEVNPLTCVPPRCFDAALQEGLKSSKRLDVLSAASARATLVTRAVAKIRSAGAHLPLKLGGNDGGGDVEAGGGGALQALATCAVNAFFDNDLLYSVQLFMQRANGSFGLCVTNSLDAERQLVIAARGQTMSVACYPRLGLVLYGSEQAAVKAALGVTKPETKWKEGTDHTTSATDSLNIAAGASSAEHAKVLASGSRYGDLAVRLDLDDLGGEVCLIDWGSKASGKASASCSR